ncbi:GDT1-like protein [Smittium culicis]|uniref:GDT1 family protein n=1 Tax=Smittium culicis TaxID=133412 RepID=A0A1R1YAH5_9FUNG|nr:GDT1-like protein [Smittium culicis]OMJ23949.1 GDT1-like protein [Smittium culicis]
MSASLSFRKYLFLTAFLLSLSTSLLASPYINDSNPSSSLPSKPSKNSILASQNTPKHDSFNKYKETLTQSFVMILFSEIGDKTFLIAAILAMKHSRMLIFISSCSALWLMSLLSALLGNVLLSFVSQKIVSLLASLTFVIFSIKMLFEAREIKDEDINDEMSSIQNELLQANLLSKDKSLSPTTDPANSNSDLSSKLEAGTLKPSSSAITLNSNSPPSFNVQIDQLDYSLPIEHASTPSTSNLPPLKARDSLSTSIKNLFSFLLSPIFVQVFALMFIAEWGDRSQIATIALGASNSVLCVTIGTIVGHTICTGLAVLCGRYLAEKISVKLLTYVGCFLFFVFGILYFIEFYSLNY